MSPAYDSGDGIADEVAVAGAVEIHFHGDGAADGGGVGAGSDAVSVVADGKWAR